MRIIAGRNRGTVIKAPEGNDTRPTLDRIRENLFNILSVKVIDSDVLDLFAGSGALAFESLSRGARFAVLCDHDSNAVRCEKLNAEKLRQTDSCEIHHCEWNVLLREMASRGSHFDIIFLDPPYAMNDLTEVTVSLLPLMNEDAVVVIEHPSAGFPKICSGLKMTDNRKYGYVGISFFRKA